jgi:hypothetical protein
MTGRAPDPVQRSRRKEDLLLASQLARGQTIGAFDELAQRADAVADRVVRIRAWLSSPLALTAGSAAGALVLGVALRRVRAARLLRWGVLGWRMWRSAGPALALYRAAGQGRPGHRSSPS